METKLIVPIAAKDLDQVKRQVKAALTGGAEMLELRTDYLENRIALSLIAGTSPDSQEECKIN